MNQKVSLQQAIPLLFALVIVSAILLLALNLGNLPAIQLASHLSAGKSGVTNTAVVEYQQTANITAKRWQAMADFYAPHDEFDYGQAAAHTAARWNAMAEFYTRQELRSANLGKGSTARWQAMGQAYEKAGLIGSRLDPVDVTTSRWQAMGSAYQKAGLIGSRVNPEDVSTLRWQAMGNAYEKAGLVGSTSP